MVHVFPSHVSLTHAVHIHPIVIPLLRRPISLDTGVFGALTILLPHLFRLLWCTFWLDRSSLRFVRSRRGFLLLGEGEAGNKTRRKENKSSYC
ncbi:hypothetical protein GA0061098_103089 [Bradyrhizobium shewense]|uniref:Uncharacterized protein n=1 Tax=Bradyrhizobium shewense TaxID=1761772 RepID=A0A1C3XRC2_9BRAD|nr:hypothetical protein GA0061098_103089 [Bradyrhizobium shewense]